MNRHGQECPEPMAEMSVSVAPASVEVVDKNESVPEPFVEKLVRTEPSERGEVWVTLDPTYRRDFSKQV